MSADFNPNIEPYKVTGSFKFWCQKVLPTVYDDSLSYYEVLCKVVNYLNDVISNVDGLQLDVLNLNTAFHQLQDYVNTYFDNLDVQSEINNKLDVMASDGTLSALLEPVVAGQISYTVAGQIGDVVAGQIDDVVEEQLGGVVAEQLPSAVAGEASSATTAWLNENVDPVGSAVTVDSSLTTSGSAGDAKVTGDRLKVLGYNVVLESGSFANDRVTKAPNSARIRNNAPIPIRVIYDFTLPEGYDMYAFWLTSELTPISASSVITTFRRSGAPANTAYVNMSIRKTDEPSADISGNVSAVQSGLVVTWNFETDLTLTVRNKPADGKATGDAIADIGVASAISTGSDLNDYNSIGVYYISNATTVANSPILTGRRFLFVTPSRSGVITLQRLLNTNDGAMYERYYLGTSGWSTWIHVNPTTGSKYMYGINPYRKACDHGGLWNRPSENYLEDSPLAFERAVNEGIMYHNVDIICSSDGVPIVSHNNTVTDTESNTHIISQHTLEEIKEWEIGTSTYSFTLMTLAELNEYVKSKGGIIDTVDVSYMTNAQASLLKGYYLNNGIEPTWTNFDDESQRLLFANSTGDFGIYISCDTTSEIESAISYIEAHTGERYAVNIYASSSGIGVDNVAPYVPTLKGLGVKIYVYIYNTLVDNPIPAWADGVMSETMNVNYVEANQ